MKEWRKKTFKALVESFYTLCCNGLRRVTCNEQNKRQFITSGTFDYIFLTCGEKLYIILFCFVSKTH